jgi:hypothetical protein
VELDKVPSSKAWASGESCSRTDSIVGGYLVWDMQWDSWLLIGIMARSDGWPNFAPCKEFK